MNIIFDGRVSLSSKVYLMREFSLNVLFYIFQKFRDLCRKDKLLSDHGHKTIRLSSANTYSYDKGRNNLGIDINEINF